MTGFMAEGLTASIFGRSGDRSRRLSHFFQGGLFERRHQSDVEHGGRSNAGGGVLFADGSGADGLKQLLPGSGETALWFSAAVFAGMSLIGMLNALLPHEHEISGHHGGMMNIGAAWLFVIAVSIHKMPEGLAIGVAYGGENLSNPESLTIGIALQNIPEGLTVGNCIDRGRLFPPEGRSGRDFERNDAAAGGGFRASDRRLRVADGAARNGFCRRGDAVCYCQRGFARNLRRQTEQKVGAGVLCRFCPHVRAEHCHAVIFS